MSEITLPNNRILSYASSGDPNSLKLLIFFHGVFGIGTANTRSKVLVEQKIHYVAPTLPGWGCTSPPAIGVSYTDTLVSDITALINHLYPDSSQHSKLIIFLSGGSFGTIPAQILYGQPFDKFPFGKQIKGLMMLSPFSKPGMDPNFNKSLSWGNWFMIGSPSYWVPWRILPWVLSLAFKPKFATPETAEQMIKQILFDCMGENEKKEFEIYRQAHGLEPGQLEKEFAMNAFKSVQYSMEGFTGLNSVMYEDWGFQPQEINAEKLNRKVLVYAAKDDQIAPNAQAVWLSKNYKNAKLVMLEGGHIVGITKIEKIWTDLLSDDTEDIIE